MDRGAWWATVLGVAKSRTRLSDFTNQVTCLFKQLERVEVGFKPECIWFLSVWLLLLLFFFFLLFPSTNIYKGVINILLMKQFLNNISFYGPLSYS